MGEQLKQPKKSTNPGFPGKMAQTFYPGPIRRK